MANVFLNGLVTGCILQLAIGHVFFFIMNLAVQRSMLDGLAGSLAVALVDYLYIVLSILGISKLLEYPKVKTRFGFVSALVLIAFGLILCIGAKGGGISASLMPATIIASFISVFLLTITSPLTIVAVTSLLTAKAIQYRYSRNQLFIFGIGMASATFLFMGTAATLLSLMKTSIPLFLMPILNMAVGALLIGYGGMRLVQLRKLVI